MVAAVKSLLPPYSTPLERALSRSLHPAELDGLGDAPARIRTDLHPAFAPWIAAEYFLSGFVPYFDDYESLIAAGLPWLRQRGTAAAVKRALNWIQITALLEDDRARLHIDPGTTKAPAQLGDIIHLVNASIPAHVHFYRLYHGWDLRHARADKSRWDDCLLDDDSGLLVDGVKLSFDERVSADLSLPEKTPLAARGHAVCITLHREQAYWDAWVLDSEIARDLFGGVGQLMVTEVEARILGAVDVKWYGSQAERAEVPRDLPAPLYASASTHTAITDYPHYRRTWSGPWAGPWRLTIQSLVSEE